MGNTAIKVEGLGKKYILRHRSESWNHRTLRDVMHNSVKALSNRVATTRLDKLNCTEEFWALRNVDFEIKQGDKVGVIGSNGSGKSTLLKILSRIVEPSEGRVEIDGRLASLLEVGTGFHAELTGRENIFLNGAILGMNRSEIKRKFDEIVDFAEIEKFLDTPVKRYSSGMYVRLAFSVAAHLEPEILVIDEVLSVGDLRFQRKCLGKMEDVAKDGRTIVFVSHNIGIVKSLCRRGILLNLGALVVDDTVDVAGKEYLKSLETVSNQELSTRLDRGGIGEFRISKINISTSEVSVKNTLIAGAPAVLQFDINGMRAGMSCCFTIYDLSGQPVTYFDSAEQVYDTAGNVSQISSFVCMIDELPLLPGRYRINVAIMCDGEFQDDIKGAAVFDVGPGVFSGRTVYNEVSTCSVLIKHRWVIPTNTI